MMPDQGLLFELFLKTLNGLALLLMVYVASYGASAWLLPGGTTARRWSGTAIFAIFLQIAIFHALAPFNAFRPGWCLALVTLVAAVVAAVNWFWPRSELSLSILLETDLARLRIRANQALAGQVRILVQICLAAACVAGCRGIFNIPITTDSLSYHLLYAGKFIQAGGWFELDSPGDWGLLCKFYPPGGEILTAWWMLPFHGDLFAGLACLPSWGLLMCALYELGRNLGLPPRRALIPAFLIGFMPAVFSFAASAYVEIPLLACLMGGVLFYHEAWKNGEWPAFILCGVAFSAALAIKILALAGAGTAFVLLTVRCASAGKSRSAQLPDTPAGRNGEKWRIIYIVIFITGILSIGARHYLALYLRYGSPTWPFPLGLPGFPLFEGSLARVENLQFIADAADKLISGGSFWRELGWALRWTFCFGPVQIGPVGVLMLFLAPLGMWVAWRNRDRGFVTYALLSLLASVAALLGAGMWKFHVLFASVNPRLHIYLFSILTLLGVISFERWQEKNRNLMLTLVVSLGAAALAFSFPITWSTGIRWLDLILLLFPVAAAFLPQISIPPVRYPGTAKICAYLSMVATGIVLIALVKYEIRPVQLMTAFEGYDMSRETSRAWRICDDMSRSRRIAFAGGKGAIGYSWGWGLLLGCRLQNDLTYVPITGDGSVIDYADRMEVARKSDQEAWYRRLRERKIDTVVLFPPNPPEYDWVISRPDRFAPEDTASLPMVFRVLAAK